MSHDEYKFNVHAINRTYATLIELQSAKYVPGRQIDVQIDRDIATQIYKEKLMLCHTINAKLNVRAKDRICATLMEFQSVTMFQVDRQMYRFIESQKQIYKEKLMLCRMINAESNVRTKDRTRVTLIEFQSVTMFQVDRYIYRLIEIQ